MFYIEALIDKIKYLFHTLSTHKGENEIQRQILFEKLVKSIEKITPEDQEKMFSKFIIIDV